MFEILFGSVADIGLILGGLAAKGLIVFCAAKFVELQLMKLA
jgi:hypothetical protein